MSASVDRLRDPRQRQERATRILDVAAELLLRHGYRRVTVDDVAAGADIGKGTVYLHWKTREELFTAVFEREVLQAIGELLRALRQDPQVSLPHRFARAYFLAIMHRPLLRGFVLGDADLLARTVQRAFERRRTIPRRAQQALATAVIELLTDLTDADRADLGIAQA